MRNYRITACCDPYHARFHYHGQEVLRYDGITPTKWVVEDGLTEAEAYDWMTDAVANDDRLWYYDNEFIKEWMTEMVECDGLTEEEATEALSWYHTAGWYNEDHCLIYQYGDTHTHDAVMTYIVEEVE